MNEKRIIGKLAICFLLLIPGVIATSNYAKSTYGAGDWYDQNWFFEPEAEDAENSFDAIGFSTTLTEEPSVSTFATYLGNSGTIHFSGHGISCSGDYELWVKDSDSDGNAECSESFGDDNIPLMADQELVVYHACNTCSGNLCSETIDNGADCAIGWSSTITNGDASCWADEFYNCLDNENTNVISCATSAQTSCSMISILSYGGSCNFVLTR